MCTMGCAPRIQAKAALCYKFLKIGMLYFSWGLVWFSAIVLATATYFLFVGVQECRYVIVGMIWAL